MEKASLSIAQLNASIHAAELNSQTRGLQTYGSHLFQIMSLIHGFNANLVVTSQKSITILGAGNCLDLDLHQLTELYQQITLIDLDSAALEFGVERQNKTNDPRIHLVAPFDLADPLVQITESQLHSADAIHRACQLLFSTMTVAPTEPADTVVSTCVISQMIAALVKVVTEQHAQFLLLLQSLRRGHIRRMLQLLKPGGTGLLISDLVSSDTTPWLQQISDAELPSVLAQCLSAGNFFSGLNPGVILQEFRTCPEIAELCQSVQILPPWKWQMGPRTYAVFAIAFERVLD